MLLNPASADRMQPNREEKCEHKVKKSRPTAKINDCHVVEHRTRKINKEPAVPHLDRFQTGWACQLKEWKSMSQMALRYHLLPTRRASQWFARSASYS